MNKVEIKDIKKSDRVWDFEDSYVAYADARFEDGLWKCDTTCGGDYVHDLKEGDVVYDEPPNEDHPDINFWKLIKKKP